MEVVVIGAGAAGLTAAYELTHGGLEPMVFEAADHVGGRLYSCHENGYTLDLGAQVLYSTYKTFFALCRQLDLAHELIHFTPTTDILRGEKRFRQFAVLDTWQKRLSIARLRIRLVRWRTQLDVNRPDRLPLTLARQSLAYYARTYHGAELLDDLFQPFAASLVHDQPERIAAGAGLVYIRCALGRSFAMRPGMGTLTTALGKEIRQIHLSTPVRRVHINDGRVTGVTICSGAAEQVIPCEVVISAVPAPIAASLMPDLPDQMRHFLATVRYSACIHVLYGLRRPLLGEVYALILPGKTGLHIASLLEDANKNPSSVPPGGGLLHAMTYGAASQKLMAFSDEETAAVIGQDVRQVIPDFPDQPLFYKVQRWDRSVCLFGPGYSDALRNFQAKVDSIRGLYFAGDFVKIPSVEGAMRSGQEAADRVLRDRQQKGWVW